MLERIRGKISVGNLQYRSEVALAKPVVTSSLQSGTTTARLYALTVVVPADAGIGATGDRKSTIWPFILTTDSDGLLPISSAQFTGATNGAQGAVRIDSTLNYSAGRFITNSTGHAIAIFTSATGAASTSYLKLIGPDGQFTGAAVAITTSGA